MALEVTRYETGTMDVLKDDEYATVTVADGATTTLISNGLYLIKATSGCRVRCKAGITNATGGRTWDAGEKEVRYLLAGTVVAAGAI